MIEIYYTSFDEFFPDKLWKHYLSSFSPEIQQKIMRYKMQKNQHQSLLGKLLLQKKLKEKGILKTDLSDLKYELKDKPYLENKPFQFNISHSENTIMCAFSEKKVGIDVERMKNVDYSKFKLFFTASELLHIQSASNPQQAFFEYWTLKEAVLKFTGEGISANLFAFEIEKEKVKYFEENYMYETELLNPEYLFTVVAKEKIEKKLTYVDFRNFA
jgi:4'-phosphopantetheinyl transferase